MKGSGTLIYDKINKCWYNTKHFNIDNISCIIYVRFIASYQLTIPIPNQLAGYVCEYISLYELKKKAEIEEKEYKQLITNLQKESEQLNNDLKTKINRKFKK